MKVEIQLKETSQPLEYLDPVNAYTKGPMYCVLFVDGSGERVTHKYPLNSIFRVIESYPESKRV